MSASPAVILSKSPTGRAAQPRVAVTVHVSPDLRDRLARAAQEQHRPLATLVREILAVHVERQGV